MFQCCTCSVCMYIGAASRCRCTILLNKLLSGSTQSSVWWPAISRQAFRCGSNQAWEVHPSFPCRRVVPRGWSLSFGHCHWLIVIGPRPTSCLSVLGTPDKEEPSMSACKWSMMSPSTSYFSMGIYDHQFPTGLLVVPGYESLPKQRCW